MQRHLYHFSDRISLFFILIGYTKLVKFKFQTLNGLLHTVAYLNASALDVVVVQKHLVEATQSPAKIKSNVEMR